MKAEAKGADGETVIVLDPGHSAVSGDLGAQYPPYNEGQMTLELAQYIAGELSQYDNVKVYLTRRFSLLPPLQCIRRRFEKRGGSPCQCKSGAVPCRGIFCTDRAE